jgi:XRE family transcriptional regulator, fatty acid utilization regulator
MSLGAEVRRRRLALGLTLDDLAERSGLSPHYLSTLENDRRDPRVSTLVAIAKALRLEPAELLGKGHVEEPAAGALFDGAPPAAKEAVTTLVRLIVAGRSTAKKKRRR